MYRCQMALLLSPLLAYWSYIRFISLTRFLYEMPRCLAIVQFIVCNYSVYRDECQASSHSLPSLVRSLHIGGKYDTRHLHRRLLARCLCTLDKVPISVVAIFLFSFVSGFSLHPSSQGVCISIRLCHRDIRLEYIFLSLWVDSFLR